MRLPSANQHKFAENPSVHMSRSAFDRKHSNSLTFDAGYLIPFFHEADVLPGDTMNLSATIFARLNTPYFPIMTNVYMMVHFWAVPNRLLWNHWVNFQGEQDDPDDTTVYMTPQSEIPESGYFTHSLQDYFGLPVVQIDPSNPANDLTIAGLKHNVFLTRAYNMIWNRGYRDENLQDRVPLDLGDGPDDPADYVLLKRGKRHDYFTSALPWPQKGDPVGISLSGDAQILGTLPGQAIQYRTAAAGGGTNLTGLNEVAGAYPYWNDAGSAGNRFLWQPEQSVSGLTADLSDLTAITINQFRSAFLMQELLETDARGGTRYPEMILAHFGVNNPDSRMQYPEYLGGNVTSLDITSVPQMSESGETPQGNLAAFGTFTSTKNGFVKSFTEHSVVIGLLCVYADLTYSQGLARHWSRRTRADFYMPVFANLGEMAILNKEIYAQGTAGGASDDAAFGYQEHWADYRYMPNRVTGLFRLGVRTSLSSWNLSQYFADLPALSSDFIEENPPFNRVVVVQDEPDFKADCFINLTHVRPMPVRSIPVKLGGNRSY